MKILCVEDGSVDTDALENGELRDGKVLIYRQGAKPPFVLDIPNNNIPRVLKELEEINLMAKNGVNRYKYGFSDKYEVFDYFYEYTKKRIEKIEKELLEKVGD